MALLGHRRFSRKRETARSLSSENILAQTPAPKVPASPSYEQFGKDTQIGQFLRFYKGGTKAKSPIKYADLTGPKITLAQIELSYF